MIDYKERGEWGICHFLKPTQELGQNKRDTALRFNMAVAYTIHSKEL